MKILVADDNPDNRDLVRDVLDMAGYTILEAENGARALTVTFAEMPDLILLDVNMPGMSGFEVCAQVKQDERSAQIPVIMLTAMSDVENRVKGLAVGADDYLTKPFSPRELLARVERTLKAKVQADEMRGKADTIQKTFKRFVAASVVEQLLEDPDQVKLGGKMQDITVIFADLEGFTSLSERIAPEEVLQLLNSYHSLIVKIALMYKGTIDKFIGDGVMILYNTPITQDDHVARAVKTALHLQDELHWFRENLPEAHRLATNFGIHTGKAIVGNVGSSDLMDFTAIGDTVNVAARLQQTAHGGQILVSDAVFKQVEDFVFGRSRGVVQLKNRQSGVVIYQISNTYFD